MRHWAVCKRGSCQTPPSISKSPLVCSAATAAPGAWPRLSRTPVDSPAGLVVAAHRTAGRRGDPACSRPNSISRSRSSSDDAARPATVQRCHEKAGPRSVHTNMSSSRLAPRSTSTAGNQPRAPRQCCSPSRRASAQRSRYLQPKVWIDSELTKQICGQEPCRASNMLAGFTSRCRMRWVCKCSSPANKPKKMWTRTSSARAQSPCTPRLLQDRLGPQILQGAQAPLQHQNDAGILSPRFRRWHSVRESTEQANHIGVTLAARQILELMGGVGVLVRSCEDATFPRAPMLEANFQESLDATQRRQLQRPPTSSK